MRGIQELIGAVQSAPIAHMWNTDTTVVTVLVFFAALIYAAVQDIGTKEVGDYIHVIIAVSALIDFDRANLPAMLIGAIVTALPLFVGGLILKGSIGGADIKLMAASGLLLGAANGIIALVIGLFTGVACTYIYRRVRKTDMRTSFPLVPYLAAGCIVAYMLQVNLLPRFDG